MFTSSPRHAASKSKRHCKFFFIEDQNEGLLMCRKCGNGKAKNGGWTNLLNQLKTCVGKSYEEIYNETKKQETTVMGHFVIRQVSTASWKGNVWVDWVHCDEEPPNHDCWLPLYAKNVQTKANFIQESTSPHHVAFCTFEGKNHRIPSRKVCVGVWWLDRGNTALHWCVSIIQ